MMGDLRPVEHNLRQSGRTTRTVLRALLGASTNPGFRVLCVSPTQERAKKALELTMKISDAAGLEPSRFSGMSIRFRGFGSTIDFRWIGTNLHDRYYNEIWEDAE